MKTLSKLAGTLALAFITLASPAHAEGKLRVAEQFGVVYLLLNVAQDQKLIEKHGEFMMQDFPMTDWVMGFVLFLGSSFLASLLIGIVQTFAVAMDQSLATGLTALGMAVSEQTFGYEILKLTISQVAPILPYLFLVLILIFRPKGLLGPRED